MNHFTPFRFLIVTFLLALIACKEEAVVPKPLAAFSISKSSAGVNEPLSFTNTSQNANSFSWDFGDGNTSTDENPTHVYSAAGTFNITLTASGEGGTHTASKSIIISFPNPIASFTLAQSPVEVGDTVYFTNTSQNANSFSWDFGDGNTSTDENPTHVYTSDGTFIIRLTAEGEGGSHSATQTIEVTAPAFAGRWDLQSGTYNGAEINNLTGYFEFVNESTYKAKFDNGTYSGTIFTAGYTLDGSTFKTNIDGSALALNGISSQFTCCPNQTLWQASMSCSRLVFNQWGKTAIGFGDPKVEIIGESLVISSADGKTVLTYSK